MLCILVKSEKKKREETINSCYESYTINRLNDVFYAHVHMFLALRGNNLKQKALIFCLCVFGGGCN